MDAPALRGRDLADPVATIAAWASETTSTTTGGIDAFLVAHSGSALRNIH
jgi:hypothetical protein